MQKTLLTLIGTFFITALTIEFIENYFLTHAPYDNYWDNRTRKERVMVDLYAENIWRNGKSTFSHAIKSESCSLTKMEKFFVRWTEVTCFAIDNNNQSWRKTERFNDMKTSLFLIPFAIKPDSSSVLTINGEIQ